MARGYTTRKLEVWAIHAHRDRKGEVDYRQLFRDLAKLDATKRIHTTSDKVIALPLITVYKSGLVRLQVYEGPRDTQPLVYDTEDGSERLATTRATEVVTTKTHAYVDTETAWQAKGPTGTPVRALVSFVETLSGAPVVHANGAAAKV